MSKMAALVVFLFVVLSGLIAGATVINYVKQMEPRVARYEVAQIILSR